MQCTLSITKIQISTNKKIEAYQSICLSRGDIGNTMTHKFQELGHTAVPGTQLVQAQQELECDQTRTV